MARLRKVRNRGGELVPFRQSRVAESIREAVCLCGLEDDILASELAGVVTLFLEKHYDDENPPALDDIRDMISRVLVETGHRRISQAYLRLTQRGAELPSPASVGPEWAFSEGPGSGDEPPRVANVDPVEIIDSDDQLARPFDSSRLMSSLERELGLAETEAREIAIEVESKLMRSGLGRAPATLVREFVDSELAVRGQETLLKRHRLFGVSGSVIDGWLFPAQVERRDPEEAAGTRVLAAYALDEIYSRPVARAHADGRLHLNGLGHPQRVDEIVLDATGPLFPASGRSSDFLLELVTLLQSVRPLVGRRITLSRFAEAYARFAPATVTRRGVQAFARRLLEHLLKVDVFGRPILPPLNLELHLTGDHLSAPGAGSNLEAARVVRLLSETLLSELENRPKLAGRLGLSFLLSATPPYVWPESPVLDQLLTAARKHRGVSLRLLRHEDEVGQGGGLRAREAVRLEVGSVAINLPVALALQVSETFDDVTSALGGAVGLAVDALFEKYWFLRRSAPETLRGLLAHLPGGKGLRIEGAEQGARLELWGLPHAVAMLQAQGLIKPEEAPQALARILSCADYHAGEERENIQLDISIGGVVDRDAKRRLATAAQSHALRLGHMELASVLVREDVGAASLPLLSPLSSPENQVFFQSSALARMGAGLPLPARGDDAIANSGWLRRLFEGTALRYLELEERPDSEEFQGSLFEGSAGRP
ncbi:MAG: ATP cone domain-containing protein [Planctomycetota bacterium]